MPDLNQPRLLRSVFEEMTTTQSDQIAVALQEIVICIAQGVHEISPHSMNFAAAKAYSRLKERGDHAAAEILYQFGRALLDRSLFPEPVPSTTGSEEPSR